MNESQREALAVATGLDKKFAALVRDIAASAAADADRLDGWYAALVAGEDPAAVALDLIEAAAQKRLLAMLLSRDLKYLERPL